MWQEGTGVKNREKEMLYPEKEKWSSPGGSVILQHKNTNHYATSLCQRSDDVYDHSFQSVVPRPKASMTPETWLEMQILRSLLTTWSWGLAIRILTRSRGMDDSWSTWRSAGVRGLCTRSTSPRVCTTATWAPESHQANPQEQMGPGDSSARLEMKYKQQEALLRESSLPQDKLRKT